jgi:hypothetical protein
MIHARSWIPVLPWLTLAVLATGCAKPVPLPAEGLRPLPLLVDTDLGIRTRFFGIRTTFFGMSLQPRLQWEAFPRPEDLKADKEGSLGSARSVTYELRIWRAEREVPGVCQALSWTNPCVFPTELVYARGGLVEPVHTVEAPLAPDTLYVWTVRARFDLNGRPRVTQWAVLTRSDRDPQLPTPRDMTIPSLGYYRLKTPASSADPAAAVD